MGKRKIGSTDLEVAKIGLGAWSSRSAWEMGLLLLASVLGGVLVMPWPAWATSGIEAELERVGEARRIRAWDVALETLGELEARYPEDVRVARQVALVYQAWEQWQEAEEAWRSVSELDSSDTDALPNAWESHLKAAGHDSTAAFLARQRILSEVLEKAPCTALFSKGMRLSDYLPRSRALWCLTVAYRGLALADTAPELITPIVDAILEKFPYSEIADEICGEEFYDGLYDIWRDHASRVPHFERFLAKYTSPEWRIMAYSWMGRSLGRLIDEEQEGETEELLDDLKNALARFRDEFPNDPRSWNLSAEVYLRQAGSPDSALLFAEEAYRLLSEWKQPERMIDKAWELERPIQWTKARLSIAEACLELERPRWTEYYCNETIEESISTNEDEVTPAGAYFLLGQALDQQGRHVRASEAYARCLVAGDDRREWTARADSVLRLRVEEIIPTLGGPTDHVEWARQTLGYEGPVFTHVDSIAGITAGGRRPAWGDADGDGDDDLLLSGIRLYINQGDGSFVDVSLEAGLGDTVDGEYKPHSPAGGAVWADYDNDGRLDFYAIGKEDCLWHNESKNGEVRFLDATASAGNPTNEVSTEGAGWGDGDNDGFVDLYLANYEVWRDNDSHPYPDQYFRNSGQGTFEEVTSEVGIAEPFGHPQAGRGVNWGDFDNDGDLDIYVSVYRLKENFLWENDGTGHFVNTALPHDVAGVEVDGWWGHTIGSQWGDYDNDGDLDLVTGNLAHPRYIDFSNKTMLYENQGWPDFLFVDRRTAAGIKFEETHSDVAWGDVDADGDLDLFITSVYPNCKSFLYLNNGDGTFRDVTWLSGVRVFNGWGLAFSDYDGDGDLDLYIAGSPNGGLYRNETGAASWIEVICVGTWSNRAAIGSRVTVCQGGECQIREVEGGKGTTSQSSLVQHFGLGGSGELVTIGVRFPSGRGVTLKGVTPNQLVEVVEPR